nr:hypothetical protein GCM10017745_18110 [Saccharothrix mutabilis subsp. capreolus]
MSPVSRVLLSRPNKKIFLRELAATGSWLLEQFEDWHERDQLEFAGAPNSFTDELIASSRAMSRVRSAVAPCGNRCNRR